MKFYTNKNSANSLNEILADGEMGYEKDSGSIKVGNGIMRYKKLNYSSNAIKIVQELMKDLIIDQLLILPILKKGLDNLIVNPTPTLSSTLEPPDIANNTTFNYTPISPVANTLFFWSRAQVAGINNPSSSGLGDPNETLVNITGAPISVTYVYNLLANGVLSGDAYSVVVVVNN